MYFVLTIDTYSPYAVPTWDASPLETLQLYLPESAGEVLSMVSVSAVNTILPPCNNCWSPLYHVTAGLGSPDAEQ